MKVKNLVVANLISPMSCMTSSHFSMEDSEVLSCRICRKETKGYLDLESNRKFSEKKEIGYDRVDEETITPLSEYYNFLGMKKRNNHENKKAVYAKVKKLKREGKLKDNSTRK